MAGDLNNETNHLLGVDGHGNGHGNGYSNGHGNGYGNGYGNGHGNDNGHHYYRKYDEPDKKCTTCKCKMQFAALVVAVIGAVVWLSSDKPESSPLPMPELNQAEIAAAGDPSARTGFMYRPICLTYGKAVSARILQTSMGSPSRQWSHIPCYSQPEKVRRWATTEPPTANVNAFGAPDAILQTDLSRPAFDESATPILGFGAAFTEASALNYQSLSDKGKETLMELLYGKSGLGYSLGRVHINSCDFSIASYSFDDTDGDFELRDFDMNVTHDAQKDGMIDMALRATTVFNTDWNSTDGLDGHFKMYASPWSPPAWMKAPTPSDPAGAEHAAGMTGSDEPSCFREGTGPDSKYAKAWALYFSKFISAYREKGVPFWAVTVQNEPEFPAPWEACSYTPEVQADFVAHHLGPQLEEDHPDVKIFMFDHNKDHIIHWAEALLNKTSPSSKYVSGTAYHWYAGGMDRLLDGAVGAPNMHRLQKTLGELAVGKDHVVLGSEACHCPYTGYAGGDIEVYWSRAERYAHTILSDLAAGSNGWVEWNVILDSVGGPNHLNNLCDTIILAVPHRATNSSDVPPTMPWEKTKNRFGTNVGDGRTREELNALGFPAKHLDDGLAVQPMYYYMGHISRYVRPGSRAMPGLVETAKNGLRAFRSPGEVVAGGGMNDLARVGIEVTAWPCEGSTRQQFFFNKKGQLEVLGHDWLGNPTTSCIGRKIDKSFQGVTLAECTSKKAATFDMVTNEDGSVRYVQTNSPTTNNDRCLSLVRLSNSGGAYGVKGGSQVSFAPCAEPNTVWRYSAETHEVLSNYLVEGAVCMTTGWPFLQMGAFSTPNGESDNTIVLLNEARDTANFVLYDGEDPLVSGSIPPRSIQTILIDSA